MSFINNELEFTCYDVGILFIMCEILIFRCEKYFCFVRDLASFSYLYCREKHLCFPIGIP